MFYAILIVVLCILLPVVGLAFSFPLYLKANNTKKKIITSILLGILVGIFAFYFAPREDFDLIFHRSVVEKYVIAENVVDFNIISENIDLEIVPRVLSYLVSKLNNINLLQFFVVLAGFSAIFYILIDYKDKIKLDSKRFIPFFLLGLFGQPIIFYFSGLYCYLAISILALALYLDYIKNIKIAPYVLYVLAFLTHNSMAFPIVYILLFKVLGNKFNIKFIVTAILSAFFITFLLSFLVNDMGIGFLSGIEETFERYTSRNDSFQNIYTGGILALDIIKILFTLITSSVLFMRKNKELNAITFFILILSIVIIILSTKSVVMTRFISLVFYLGIIFAMNIVKTDKKMSWYVVIASSLLAVVLSIYNIASVYPYGYADFIKNDLTKNATNILKDRE